MTTLIALLTSKAGGVLVAVIVGAGTLLMAFLRGKQAGHDAERAKATKRDLDAANERLEMHREATDIERQTGGMSRDDLKREAGKWGRD